VTTSIENEFKKIIVKNGRVVVYYPALSQGNQMLQNMVIAASGHKNYK
jgi:hypothetical protein